MHLLQGARYLLESVGEAARQADVRFRLTPVLCGVALMLCVWRWSRDPFTRAVAATALRIAAVLAPLGVGLILSGAEAGSAKFGAVMVPAFFAQLFWEMRYTEDSNTRILPTGRPLPAARSQPLAFWLIANFLWHREPRPAGGLERHAWTFASALLWLLAIVFIFAPPV